MHQRPACGAWLKAQSRRSPKGAAGFFVPCVQRLVNAGPESLAPARRFFCANQPWFISST